MKRLLCIAASVAAIGLISIGQPAEADTTTAPPAQSATAHSHDGPLADLSYLNLTADQSTQVEQIKSNAKTQYEAVKADTTLSTDAKKAKGREILRTAIKQVVAILTQDQKKLFVEHLKAARANRTATQ